MLVTPASIHKRIALIMKPKSPVLAADEFHPYFPDTSIEGASGSINSFSRCWQNDRKSYRVNAFVNSEGIASVADSKDKIRVKERFIKLISVVGAHGQLSCTKRSL